MPKRKSDTTERDWLRRNVPARTLTRRIDKALTDIRKHTAPTLHESDEDGSQTERHRAEPLKQAQEGENPTQVEEQRAEPFIIAQESDDDSSQIQEQTAEHLTLGQENNEDATQIQQHRAGSSTMLQDSVPQELQDVDSHGLTEGQMSEVSDAYMQELKSQFNTDPSGVSQEEKALLTDRDVHSWQLTPANPSPNPNPDLTCLWGVNVVDEELVMKNALCQIEERIWRERGMWDRGLATERNQREKLQHQSWTGFKAQRKKKRKREEEEMRRRRRSRQRGGGDEEEQEGEEEGGEVDKEEEEQEEVEDVGYIMHDLPHS
ncbi:hypothetical protein WMY93_023067 [Mugilogobius chulae]|uniref:Uncharacterized protein n=1 Tax=Mugilogobius chulae TaxID=88201 RepID=A0AAW0N3A9_9GOBI